MLDASTITVSAFAHASRKRRVRRAIISLIVFLLLLTVGAGATYSAFTNPPERTGIKHEALLPPADAILTAGETVPTRGAAAIGVENILLIGSDTLGNVTKASTDIIVWAHISSDRKTVHLVHFPGNLWSMCRVAARTRSALLSSMAGHRCSSALCRCWSTFPSTMWPWSPPPDSAA